MQLNWRNFTAGDINFETTAVENSRYNGLIVRFNWKRKGTTHFLKLLKLIAVIGSVNLRLLTARSSYLLYILMRFTFSDIISWHHIRNNCTTVSRTHEVID